jgi:hypothetical protein
MAIKYLGKIRPIAFAYAEAYMQMVNVPELQDCQRCPFCYYHQSGRSDYEYYECMRDHKCGNESLIFLPMVNRRKLGPEILHNFTLTPVTKQLTIDNQKRYLQLFSSDIKGYECNQLCQYYPARIAAEQSIADCANSHACGRNGSFWDLLTPRFPYLANYPEINSDIIDETTFLTFDGRVIKGLTLDTIVVDTYSRVRAQLSDGSRWEIANMLSYSSMAGSILRHETNLNAKLFTWQFNAATLPDLENTLIITQETEPIALKLVEMGYPSALFELPLKDLALITISTDVKRYFVNDDFSFEEVATSSYRIIVIKSYLDQYKYVISFANQAQTYLGTKFPNDPPSKWTRVSPDDFAPTDYRVITLNSYTDDMAKWLMRIGVRQSVFFFK